MFTKSKDEITFEDVETFCKERPEGVRVVYKREIEDIPKIVSSFANTYGGIIIIGVKTDESNNKPILPIDGIPKEHGIEEQIQQNAYEGIYSPVTPTVKIVKVPISNRVVIIVRVDESVRAPHAIEDRTKIYRRTGNSLYDLVEIDRSQYMLKRSKESQQVTQQILKRIKERTESIGFPQDVPSITVIARPVFLDRPLISPPDIYELYLHKNHIKRVVGGICYTLEKSDLYIEVNEYGVVYRKEELHTYEERTIDYDMFVWNITELIQWASELYEKSEYLGSILVSVQLKHVLNTKLLSDQERGLVCRGQSTLCLDSDLPVETQCVPLSLYNPEARQNIVEDLILKLLWAFNVPIDDTRVRERVRERIQA